MLRQSMLGLAIVVAGCTATVDAQDGPAPGDGPGWTGITKPEDVIAARSELMMGIEDLMIPIDTYTVDPSVDTDVIAQNAVTIHIMLQALPHLFPPTTNVYDPDAEYPETLALPHIWEDFDGFYAMADAAAQAAEALSETREPDARRAGALALRATCDACHALNLRPYEEGHVTEEDLNFDFDSVFQN